MTNRLDQIYQQLEIKGLITNVSYQDNKNSKQNQSFIHNQENKSMLISVLTSSKKDNIAEIKSLLQDYAQEYAQLDLAPNLYIKLLETPITPYYLCNLFITNNKQPQLVYLGADIYKTLLSNVKESLLYNAKEPKLTIKAYLVIESLTNRPVYCYETDNPLASYQSQLVNLGSNADFKQGMQKIEHLFKEQLTHILQHKSVFEPIEIYNTDDMNQGPIRILDLKWLLNQTDNKISLSQSDLKPNSRLNKIVQKIMRKFAQEL